MQNSLAQCAYCAVVHCEEFLPFSFLMSEKGIKEHYGMVLMNPYILYIITPSYADEVISKHVLYFFIDTLCQIVVAQNSQQKRKFLSKKPSPKKEAVKIVQQTENMVIALKKIFQLVQQSLKAIPNADHALEQRLSAPILLQYCSVGIEFGLFKCNLEKKSSS